MNSSRNRFTANTWLLCGLLALCATSAWADTSYTICARSIRSAEALLCQQAPTVDVDQPLEVPIDAWDVNLTPPDQPHLTCSFQFWAHGGEFFTADQLPSTVSVAPGTAPEITAWFVCAGGGSCQNPPCPFDTDVIAIDSSNSSWVPEPFIDDAEPDAAIGTCAVDSPCHTTQNIAVDKLTAKASAAGLDFVGWLGGALGDRTLVGPFNGGFRVAIYRDREPNPCSLDPIRALTTNGPCGWRPPEAILEMDLEHPMLTDLDRICHYVLNCPGCGPFGLCAPFQLTIDGPGIEHIRVMLHDRETGKILEKGQRLHDGAQVLQFVPEKGEFDRYFLSFVPTGKDIKLDRAKLRMKLDVAKKF